MTIGYTVLITDFSDTEDKFGGNIPGDDEGRTFDVILKVAKGEREGVTMYKDSKTCCQKLRRAFFHRHIGLVTQGTYPDHKLWLHLPSSEAFKLGFCPFCGEEIKFECQRVEIRKPTFERTWTRAGSETLEVQHPQDGDDE